MTRKQRIQSNVHIAQTVERGVQGACNFPLFRGRKCKITSFMDVPIFTTLLNESKSKHEIGNVKMCAVHTYKKSKENKLGN